jgi:hypothetical protein
VVGGAGDVAACGDLLGGNHHPILRYTPGGSNAFPGLGHLRRDPDRYTWVPVTFMPVESPLSPESSQRQRTSATTL